MRVLIQRVSSARVDIGGRRVASIGSGLLLLCGFLSEDTATDLEWMARKVAALRIFDDDAGVMNRSVVETGGELLAVSQFTLMASTRKGNRPSYIAAAPPDVSAPLYERFKEYLERETGRPVASGVFGADMQVSLVNDGPVTIWIDSKNKE